MFVLPDILLELKLRFSIQKNYDGTQPPPPPFNFCRESLTHKGEGLTFVEKTLGHRISEEKSFCL